MPRPIPLKQVIRVLRDKGFFFVSQKGSHAKFRKPGSPTRTVIVKMAKKEVPYGTFQSILLQSELKESDFREEK
ncbi:MAG: type II toxin-antitoxin system HicA family toxin [Candidatus Vogelbacteria bacterium]|nr:type II toxin-antitoxin system HicA family toxin [Candidatus Vogelbacteria bacterium]